MPPQTKRLHHAVSRARAVNLVELELPVLVAPAQLAHVRGCSGEARVHLEDVWEGAERGPYPAERGRRL